jgi:hypothetical protein
LLVQKQAFAPLLGIYCTETFGWIAPAGANELKTRRFRNASKLAWTLLTTARTGWLAYADRPGDAVHEEDRSHHQAVQTR